MTNAQGYNTNSGVKVIWTVEGVEHDHVENFYSDLDTGATMAKCFYDCCCKKREEKHD